MCSAYQVDKVTFTVQKVESRLMRDLATKENMRADGRRCDEVRPIACRAGLLPCTHGSALFTRGETQTISVTTLGTVSSYILSAWTSPCKRSSCKSSVRALHAQRPRSLLQDCKETCLGIAF